MSIGEDIEREIQESIRKRMADREEYIRQCDQEYKKRCEEIEFQIASYIRPYINTFVSGLYVIGAIVFVSYYLFQPHSYWFAPAFAAILVVAPILNWREKRRMRQLILKIRQGCAEPTARDYELSLALGDENTCEHENSMEELRDNNRQMLILTEMRYRNRYGEEP